MKELSIEEKAKAYDEALKAAITAHKDEDRHLKATLERIFPELPESEDEKVRKELIDFIIKANNGVTSILANNYDFNKWLAWLKKQGDKDKFIEKELGYIKGYRENAIKRLEELEKQGEQKANYTTIVETGDGGINAVVTEELSTDKVEPKFHEGEWITNGDYTWKIVEIKPLDYILQSQDGNIVDDTISHVEEQFHSFTIKDARDGDVLTFKNDICGIIICKSPTDYDTGSYCRLVNDNFINKEESGWDSTLLVPAAKEQRTELFLKMHEAGYEWDAINLKLNRISQRMVSAEAKEAMYDKPKWNVSDFRTWQYIVSDVLTKKDGIGQYLDSGECKKIAKYMQEEWSKKLNIEQKPAWSDEDMKIALRTEYEKGRADVIAEMQGEWSEEDDITRKALINLVEMSYGDCIDKSEKNRLLDWLKSLSPQNRWKPSEEQMKALKEACDEHWEPDGLDPLYTLYQDLKKLKEE